MFKRLHTKYITLAAIAMLSLIAIPFPAQAQDSSPFQSLMDEIDQLKQEVIQLKSSLTGKEEQIVALQQTNTEHLERIELCSNEPVFSQRLVCYDDIARDLNFTTVQDAETSKERIEKIGFWEITRRANHLGEEVIYLSVNSVEPVVSRTGTRRVPSFTIRCQSKKTDAFLDWKASLNAQRTYIKDQEITYKIDNNPHRLAAWELSQDNHAAFSKEPIEFVRKIKGAEKLVLMVTPFGDRSATLVFPVAGIESALDILVKQCYK